MPVVTCTIYRDNKFLVIRRHNAAKKYGGTWAFAGGKVEPNETIASAIRREVEEETALKLEDRVWLLDTYYYTGSIGLHFAVFALPGTVICEEGVEYKWLKDLEALQELPRIPGIDFHIIKANEYFTQDLPFLSLTTLDYTPDKYTN